MKCDEKHGAGSVMLSAAPTDPHHAQELKCGAKNLVV
jgi:hypothetical protein